MPHWTLLNVIFPQHVNKADFKNKSQRTIALKPSEKLTTPLLVFQWKLNFVKVSSYKMWYPAKMLCLIYFFSVESLPSYLTNLHLKNMKYELILSVYCYVICLVILNASHYPVSCPKVSKTIWNYLEFALEEGSLHTMLGWTCLPVFYK